MVAWKNAIIINTAAGYRAFLAQYPDSDLTRDRAQTGRAAAQPAEHDRGGRGSRQRARHQRGADLSLQHQPQPAPLKKVDAPAKPTKKKVVEPDPPKRAAVTPPKRRIVEEDVVVVRRPPPREVYEPSGPPVSMHRHWDRRGGCGGRYGGYGGGYNRRGGY